MLDSTFHDVCGSIAATKATSNMEVRQLWLLMTVADDPGKSIGDYAAMAGTNKPCITRAQQGLGSRGLMTSREDKKDKRRVCLNATATGRRIVGDSSVRAYAATLRHLTGSPLTIRQIALLAYLCAEPDRRELRWVHDWLATMRGRNGATIPKPALSRAAARLKALGLITRQRDPKDRRMVRMTPTQKGINIITDMFDTYRSVPTKVAA